MLAIYLLLFTDHFFTAAQDAPLISSQDIKAIDPTASGEIGVNMYSYIGTDTVYYTAEQSTTRWIGVNSVIVTTITKTTSGIPVTVTTSEIIAVSTATEPSTDIAVGDLSFIITPAGKAKLNDIFTKAVGTCGSQKLKARQLDAVLSCALRYIQDTEPELLKGIQDLVGDFIDGAGNLIEYVFTGIEFGALLEAGETLLSSAIVLMVLRSWILESVHAVDAIINVVKIPASKVGTKTATSSARSSSVPTPSPLLSPFPHPIPTAFDPISATAIASYILHEFLAMEKLLDSTTTTAETLPTPQPTNAAADCNGGRKLPSYIVDTDSFNKKAAALAIPIFCEDNPFTYNVVAQFTCPTWRGYPIDKDKLTDKVNGKYPHVYFGMQWDHNACPDRIWWDTYFNRVPLGSTYLTGPVKKEDCKLAFTASLNECDIDDVESFGALISFKCIKYFMFPSWKNDVNLCGAEF